MLRKVILFVLIFAISVPSVGFARTKGSEDAMEKPRVVHGTDSFSRKSYSLRTKFNGIRASADGSYAMEVNAESGIDVVPVGRLDVDLLNDDDFDKVLNSPKVPIEVKTKLQLRREQLQGAECTTASVSLFSEDLLPDVNLRPKSFASKATSSTTYATYKGAKMKTYKVFYTGISTGWKTVSKGSKTASVAKLVNDVTLTAAGTSSRLSIFTTGISLLAAFLNFVNDPNWATGASGDYSQIRLVYNNTDQWTYREVAGYWECGLNSQSVSVTKIGCEEHFYNTAKQQGKTYTHDRTLSSSKVMKSTHFDSPWATAYQWASNPKVEEVTWKCRTTTYHF